MVKTLVRSKAKKPAMKLKTKTAKRTTMKKGKILSKKAMVRKVMKKVTKKNIRKVTLRHRSRLRSQATDGQAGQVAKKTMKKAVAKKTVKKVTAAKAVMPGTIGKVIHYYDKIGVAILELSGTIVLGDLVTFRRGEKEFTQPVSSLQIDHQAVSRGTKGQVVGMKVVQVADVGTQVIQG